ncbi:hypothetical protein C5167_029578 [Papaver somniferum]|nr:hypothetical protein C5167_029578 [Papaver somniferum]
MNSLSFSISFSALLSLVLPVSFPVSTTTTIVILKIKTKPYCRRRRGRKLGRLSEPYKEIGECFGRIIKEEGFGAIAERKHRQCHMLLPYPGLEICIVSRRIEMATVICCLSKNSLLLLLVQPSLIEVELVSFIKGIESWDMDNGEKIVAAVKKKKKR